MRLFKNPKKHILHIFPLLVFILVCVWFISISPSNDRDWSIDQALLPYVVFTGDLVTIHNIRNFTYRSTTDYTPNYYDKTFNIKELTSVEYIVEPFSDWEGSAHTFLTFGFEDDSYVAISVEIRKEKGESFSALKGLFKQYELMYVIADERDAINLRANHRNDLVYLYPIKTSKENIQALFVDMLERTNALQEKPEFYNTLTNTCTTNIMKHTNTISPKRIPLSHKVLFPGYSDRLVYDLGLIDTELSFEEARKAFLINERAAQFATSSNFSQGIRGKVATPSQE